MSGWRARRAGAAPPSSVAAVVLSVRSTLRLTRAFESALFFAAALLLTRAAALASGLEEPLLRATWPLAGLCGVLCAATWWLEHPQDARATARALDERLRHHGALVTAFECETRARAPSPMEGLVARRVLERLRTAEALRALVPPLLLPVAAPTLAALALVLAADARRSPPPREVDYLALAEGLERALALGWLDEDRAGLEGDDPDGGLSREQVRELQGVLQARGSLPFSAEEWRAGSAQARASLEDLDRRMAELAQRLAPDSELRARLGQARVWVDALRMGLASGERPVPEAGSGPGGLTGGVTNGTISGSPALPAGPTTPPEPMAERDLPADERPAAPALGLQAGNWWPPEYDAVVARWLELAEKPAPR